MRWTRLRLEHPPRCGRTSEAVRRVQSHERAAPECRRLVHQLLALLGLGRSWLRRRLLFDTFRLRGLLRFGLLCRTVLGSHPLLSILRSKRNAAPANALWLGALRGRRRFGWPLPFPAFGSGTLFGRRLTTFHFSFSRRRSRRLCLISDSPPFTGHTSWLDSNRFRGPLS